MNSFENTSHTIIYSLKIIKKGNIFFIKRKKIRKYNKVTINYGNQKQESKDSIDNLKNS